MSSSMFVLLIIPLKSSILSVFPISEKWPFQSSACSSQKPRIHPQLISFSHTPFTVYQQNLWTQSLKYTQNLTTSVVTTLVLVPISSLMNYCNYLYIGHCHTNAAQPIPNSMI